ncbi:hypothetical protein F4860DRAFT_526637 [Xylaria cubensis]|nr:hypothetical protein F4860DRAFT_526637 [Xylaria cubensis]
MSPSRAVQSLYAIVDTKDSRKPLRETLGAKSLLRLMQNEALAFRQPDSSKLNELIHCYQQCQALAARHPSSEQLKESISQFMVIIDECFFFKTLTREVKTKRGRQHIVTLKVEDSSFSKSDSVERRGIWNPSDRSLTLWLQGKVEGAESSYRFSIESILHTCMHECIHAFFWLFVDEDHPQYDEQVDNDGGHGSMFIETLRVIGEKVEELTQSREWRQAREIDPYGPEEKRSGYPHVGSPGFGSSPGGFSPRGPPPHAFLPHAFPPGRFPPSGFPPNGPPPSGFAPRGPPPQGFPPHGFPPNGPPPHGFPPRGPPSHGFPPHGFPPGRFPPGGFHR